MSSNIVWILIAFVAYLCMMLVVGAFLYEEKQKRR